MRLCRVAGVAPSILLHPLDFLGADDVDALGFFPGMGMAGEQKRAVVGECLRELNRQFRVVTMGEHAEAIRRQGSLPVKPAATATPVLERAT
jgi:hypothetical protein